jgi:hypothetical protein
LLFLVYQWSHEAWKEKQFCQWKWKCWRLFATTTLLDNPTNKKFICFSLSLSLSLSLSAWNLPLFLTSFTFALSFFFFLFVIKRFHWKRLWHRIKSSFEPFLLSSPFSDLQQISYLYFPCFSFIFLSLFISNVWLFLLISLFTFCSMFLFFFVCYFISQSVITLCLSLSVFPSFYLSVFLSFCLSFVECW